MKAKKRDNRHLIGFSRNRLKGAEAFKASDLINNSVISVTQSDYGVVIDIGGALSNLPTTSNNKQVKRGRVVHKPSNRIKREALITLYAHSLIDSAVMPPNFGSEPLYFQAFLSSQMSRQDAINAPKFIGDYLQDIGITANDKFLRGQAFHRSDFPLTTTDLDTTRIEVVKLALIRSSLLRTVLEIACLARGGE